MAADRAWVEPAQVTARRPGQQDQQHDNDGYVSAVYLAHDKLRGQDVSLKVIELGPDAQNLAFEQLQEEAAIHARITDYQHVIRVNDIHRVPWGGVHLFLLSMEYADGDSLGQWLVRHRNERDRRCDQGLRYFRQACLGVASLHAADICHLDIKPENLLLVGGVLKVADFGAAAMARALAKLAVSREALNPPLK